MTGCACGQLPRHAAQSCSLRSDQGHLGQPAPCVLGGGGRRPRMSTVPMWVWATERGGGGPGRGPLRRLGARADACTSGLAGMRLLPCTAQRRARGTPSQRAWATGTTVPFGEPASSVTARQGRDHRRQVAPRVQLSLPGFRQAPSSSRSRTPSPSEVTVRSAGSAYSLWLFPHESPLPAESKFAATLQQEPGALQNNPPCPVKRSSNCNCLDS